MFGIDGPEFLVILLVLIIVIGPKDLPKMMKAFGKTMNRMRATANEFRQQFDDAINEAELGDIKNTLSDVSKLDPRKKLTKVFDPIRDVAKDVRTTLSVDPVKDETTVDTNKVVEISHTGKTAIKNKSTENNAHYSNDYVGFDSPVDMPKSEAQILRDRAKIRRKSRAMRSTPGGFVAIKRSGVYAKKAEKVRLKRKRIKT